MAARTPVSQIPKPLRFRSLGLTSPCLRETGSMLKRISVRGQGRPLLIAPQTSWPSRWLESDSCILQETAGLGTNRICESEPDSPPPSFSKVGCVQNQLLELHLPSRSLCHHVAANYNLPREVGHRCLKSRWAQSCCSSPAPAAHWQSPLLTRLRRSPLRHSGAEVCCRGSGSVWEDAQELVMVCAWPGGPRIETGASAGHDLSGFLSLCKESKWPQKLTWLNTAQYLVHKWLVFLTYQCKASLSNSHSAPRPAVLHHAGRTHRPLYRHSFGS